MKPDSRDSFNRVQHNRKDSWKHSASSVRRLVGIIGGAFTVTGAFLYFELENGDFINAKDSLKPVLFAIAPVIGGLFMLVGGIVLEIWLGMIYEDCKRRRLTKELQAHGLRVTGRVVKAGRDNTVRFNHYNPMIAEVECPFPNGTVTLKSQRLWQATPQIGDTVDVLCDPMDEQRYVMLFPDET